MKSTRIERVDVCARARILIRELRCYYKTSLTNKFASRTGRMGTEDKKIAVSQIKFVSVEDIGTDRRLVTVII